MKTTLVILTISASRASSIAATLLAAGTLTVASNHSACAWKDKEKYNKEDNYSKDSKYQNEYMYARHLEYLYCP
jgi:hypothetical protein